MSCANLPENSINKDIGILNIDSILNEEVSYIDNNVLNIEKKILINNILDTVAILSAKGSMILNVLLEIKYPQLPEQTDCLNLLGAQ